MHLQRLGGTELNVSRFGLGCARIGGVFQGGGGVFLDLLAAARDSGINFFDTADIYSQGESEALIGRAFRGQRGQVILATKAGYRLPAQRRLAGRLKPLLRPLIRWLGLRREHLPAKVRGSPSQDFSPTYLRTAVEGSLRRLGTDYIDLLQLHSPSAASLRQDGWVEALEALKRAGKIRYYGVSCDDEEAGLVALGFDGVSSLQLRLNLLDQLATATLVPRARERAVGVIARECLANGLLAKDDSMLDLKKYCASDAEIAVRTEQLTALREKAAGEGSSVARLALRYASGVEGVSVALLGASNVPQLRQLLGEVD